MRDRCFGIGFVDPYGAADEKQSFPPPDCRFEASERRIQLLASRDMPIDEDAAVCKSGT